jgi:ubiquinone/menaquinone biosynthesis C-methylase UbiE
MRDAEPFYARLASDYERTIRQLVPRYEEMQATVRAVLIPAAPARVVDVGCGPGGVAREVLEAMPDHCSLVALDASPAMVERAKAALATFGPRARVACADARSFDPDGPVDAVYSTLVLHNLPPGDRAAVVGAVASWLPVGGPFVWAEFLRFEDPAQQAAVVAYRRRFSLDAGCPPDVMERNYAKEAEDDFPPTAAEVLRVGREAGFGAVDLVWAHDAFAVFRLVR